MLFAFSTQSYLVQTHIHLPGTVLDVLDGPVTPADHDKIPGKDDPANCPLCQQAAIAGHFLTPVLVAMVLPSLGYFLVTIAISFDTHFATITHSWRGRDPPRF